jgi:hypothetical protein
MIRKLFLMLLLMCSSAFAQPTYNAIATAYVTTTISQNVVFNSAMQQGGTFTFSALAHNGGGRPGEADTANVRIQFYAAGGSLISTVNSNYSGNLANPNGAPGNPWADPSVPWSTLTVSSTNCGGSCSNVAYATVSMYGVDGSFWAGDYGPWYRAPTLQQNGGGNLLYNPEFGPAYGYNAQGWNTNPAMGACQGAWGGSNPCIVNNNGTPGQSTVGLVANQNGGGPSATGGTTSGTAGGYNNSMSTTNAGAGTGTPQTAPPPPAPTKNWQTVNTNSNPVVISAIYPTSNNSPSNETAVNAFDGNPSTKYLNFDKQNAGVTVKLSQGRVVQKFTITTANDAVERDPSSYKLYGSNDGVNWTLIKEGPLSLSDSRFTVSGEITVDNTTAYVYYFIKFPSIKNNSGNSVQIGEVTYYYDLDDGVTSTDTGSGGTPSNPGQAGSVCADCGPTITGTSTSNNVSSSSSVGPATTTSNSHNWNNTYTVIGTSTPTTTTTTTTPVTTTTWSDGTTTTSNGTSSSSQTVTYNYTVTGPNNPPVSPNVGTNKNSVYITQTNAGASNKITANQSGHGNYESITLGGSNNNINIGQGYTFSATGVATESSISNNNLSGLTVSGNSNNITNSQVGASNSSILNATGNSNTMTLTQTGNNNQGYGTISGSSNSMIIGQNGNSNIASVNLYGNNNMATVTQTGNNHGTVLNLINAGGANNVSVIQTGTGDAYSLQQTCTNPAGCSVSVIRNK